MTQILAATQDRTLATCAEICVTAAIRGHMNETYAQRMRVWFATDETVKYVGHLDMHRAWERAIRRARLPLAYTQGFNPQARLQFAAALPVGFTGQAEVADVFLNEELDPSEFVRAAVPALYRPAFGPSALSRSRASSPRSSPRSTARDYRVEVETDEDAAAFTERLAEFLARPEAWRERRKGKDISRYDLRPLIQDLALYRTARQRPRVRSRHAGRARRNRPAGRAPGRAWLRVRPPAHRSARVALPLVSPGRPVNAALFHSSGHRPPSNPHSTLASLAYTF